MFAASGSSRLGLDPELELEPDLCGLASVVMSRLGLVWLQLSATFSLLGVTGW